MLFYNDKNISIFFGQEQEKFMPADYRSTTALQLVAQPFFNLLFQKDVQSLHFAHQIHGTRGILINQLNRNNSTAFTHEGDYLITQLHATGIAIATADCLPLILYDSKNHAIAALHAGWRGAVQGIALQTLRHMNEVFGTEPIDVQAFFGPSAKVCCYEVQPSFQDNFAQLCNDKTIQQRNNRYYFDLPLFVESQLHSLGVGFDKICKDYNMCTLCVPNFCSYRKNATTFRQFTLVVMH